MAVIAALPRELRGLVTGLRPDPTLKQNGILLWQRPGAVIVAAGMGPTRVTRALGAVLQTGEIWQIVSVGLAGACVHTLRPGAVVEPAGVVDAQTGERFRLQSDEAGPLLVSTESIASVGEKARLYATYGAALVDMEAATLARLAQAHGVPFRAVKGISDAHDFELASLSRFTNHHGHFRTARFALHTAARPGTWRAAMVLGRHSNRALSALATRVEQMILQNSSGTPDQQTASNRV